MPLSIIRVRNPAFTVEPSPAGYTIKATTGHESEFNRVARELLNGTDEDFTVFPIAGQGGYEAIEIVVHAAR